MGILIRVSNCIRLYNVLRKVGTNEKVLKIIEMYKSGHYYQHELGKMFGVSRSTILGILRGDTWKDVTKLDAPLMYLYERGAWKNERQSTAT
jgi:DNA-binding XRE family transcriptional regulator